ncbi:50S ribosomal protein 5, chloroplastic [Melia azedarach]|uniref:50S ribosomal protein 5, chloroplastic n=1 Tax=Melia azedarach TaxID=155640 RepID=A0ACC1X5K8_MELAZ|nr:50S ribosomal protein 5, chloroplastic [Melia azedarach]
MALLVCFNPLPSLSSHPSSSSYVSSALAITASPVSRLHLKAIDPLAKSSNGVQICTPLVAGKRGAVIVKASSDLDGTVPTEGGEPPSNSTEEVVPVDKLPLESKAQERLDQKMRMKLAKKIRLRRKRLVRKRRMRKKGRWPPSKMKKLKNV